MEAFDNIQTLWQQQPAPVGTTPSTALIALAQKNNKKIRQKHLITMLVLGVTVLVLMAYFLYFNYGIFNQFAMGLFCMMGSLLIRIFTEYFSFRKFERIDVSNNFSLYTEQLTRFYSFRKKIHHTLTPVLYGLYCVGFGLLLPIFKSIFSAGFYWYLIISGFGFLLLFAWFIYKQNKKEMQLLAFLKNEVAGTKAD